jgi:hypothetical protein
VLIGASEVSVSQDKGRSLFGTGTIQHFKTMHLIPFFLKLIEQKILFVQIEAIY